MKIYAKLFLLTAVLALFVPQDVCGQKKRGATSRLIPAANIAVSVSLATTPRISYDNQEGEIKSDYRWLIVKVLYKFRATFRSGFTFDNLRCEVYLRTKASSGGWRKNYWFTGTQHFFSVIPGKAGKVHQVTLFMPPPLVYKYYAGSKVGTKALKDCEAVVLLYDGDRLLGQKMWSGEERSGKMDRKQMNSLYGAFQRMNDLPANKIVNGLWPREKTPWQWLSADRMDLPMTTFEKETSSKFSIVPAEDTNSENSDEDAGNKKENKSSAEKKEEETITEFTRSSGRNTRINRRKK